MANLGALVVISKLGVRGHYLVIFLARRAGLLSAAVM